MEQFDIIKYATFHWMECGIVSLERSVLKQNKDFFYHKLTDEAH